MAVLDSEAAAHVAPLRHGSLMHGSILTGSQSNASLSGSTGSSDKSMHVYPASHGRLMHSSTSTSQLPPVATLHCVVYSGMNSYAHAPLVKPSTHAQLYA